jgi:hypothetical protein
MATKKKKAGVRGRKSARARKTRGSRGRQSRTVRTKSGAETLGETVERVRESAQTQAATIARRAGEAMRDVQRKVSLRARAREVRRAHEIGPSITVTRLKIRKPPRTAAENRRLGAAARKRIELAAQSAKTHPEREVRSDAMTDLLISARRTMRRAADFAYGLVEPVLDAVRP